MSWIVYEPSAEDDNYHVAPDFGRPHNLDGISCWCGAMRLPEEPGVVIHEAEQ